MKRIIMMVLKNILFVPWGWFMLSKYAANVDKYTEGERYALLKKIDHKANVGGNITVKLKTFPTKMALCFIRIIRDYMMCWPFWKPARHLFL